MVAPADNEDEGLRDYRTSEGMKFYRGATEPFYDKTMLYDLSPKGFNGFLRCLKDRSYEYGTESVLLIPTDLQAEEQEFRHLCDRPDQDIEHIRAHVDTYLDANGRDAQNSYLVYKMLNSSLTKEAQDKVVLDEAKYTIEGRAVGALYLKAIYSRVSVDSRAEVRVLKKQLQELPKYVIEIEGNVTTLNDYVRDIITTLAQRGESSSDIMEYLFAAYDNVKDPDFHEFIRRIDQDYHYKNADVSVEHLFEITSQFYKDKVKSGTWDTPSNDQKSIIALQAQVAKANKKVTEAEKKLAKMSKSTANGKSGKSNRNGSGKNGKGKNNQDVKLPPWVSTAPKPGQPQKKNFNGESYYWCSHHKKWSNNSDHTTSTCRKLGLKKDDRHSHGETAATRMAHAYNAVTHDEDDNESL